MGRPLPRLAGTREVADTTLTIPQPYPAGGAAQWIATNADAWERRENLALAICTRAPAGAPVGAISLHFSLEHRHGEIGYWIGAAHWGQGFD